MLSAAKTLFRTMPAALSRSKIHTTPLMLNQSALTTFVDPHEDTTFSNRISLHQSCAQNDLSEVTYQLEVTAYMATVSTYPLRAHIRDLVELNKNGQNPLHIACAMGHDTIALRLIRSLFPRQLPRYLAMVDSAGHTALDLAAPHFNNAHPLMVLLSKYQKEYHAIEKQKYLDLQQACKTGDAATITYVFQELNNLYGHSRTPWVIDFFTKYRTSRSPLHLLATNNHFDLLRTVIQAIPQNQRSACLAQMDQEGQTVDDMIKKSGLQNTVQALPPELMFSNAPTEAASIGSSFKSSKRTQARQVLA